MKTLSERDWTYLGKCSYGLVFVSNRYEDEAVIVKSVRLTRGNLPDVWMRYEDGEVIIERNREVLTPSRASDLRLNKLFGALNNVVSL